MYSPGVIGTCASPLNLISFSKTTVRAGILIPSAKVSVAKTALTRPRWKRSSTAPLKLGSKPAWWAAMPRSKAVSHSLKLRTSRSSSAMFCVYRSAVRLISSRSSVDVRRNPAWRHCFTAASQPMREKIKVIAGNKLSPCSFSIMSARDNRSLGSAKRPRRFLPRAARLVISRSRFKTSGLTRPGASKRSNKRLPIRTC